MNTLIKGDIGVAATIKKLLEKGYYILNPFHEHLPYDLVITANHIDFFTLQIKYRQLKNGCVSLDLRTTHTNGKGIQHKKYDLSIVDIFAIYCPDNDTVYFVPSIILEDKSSIQLRIEDCKLNNLKTINWANNYLDI